jgi:hypothetical protein
MRNFCCSATVTALLLAIPASAQTNATSAASPLGCVEKTDSVYTLTDESSHAKFQLRGGKLKAGRHVQVEGALATDVSPAEGATQVIDVTSVKRVAGSCSATPSGAGSSFISRGTAVSIGVVAGVAAVAAWATISRLGEARGGK